MEARILLLANLASGSLTEVLGIVAIVAFLGTAAAVSLIVFGDSAAKRRSRELNEGQTALQQALKPLKRFDENFDKQMKRLEEEVNEFVDALTQNARQRFATLAEAASAALLGIGRAYSAHANGYCKVPEDRRPAYFVSLCEGQWAFFRGELSYMEYGAVRQNLRRISEVCRFYEDDDANTSASPDFLRSQEIAVFVKGIRKERILDFQREMVEVARPFCSTYEKTTKQWVNETIFKIVSLLNDRSSKGVMLRDSQLRDRLMAFRNQFESLARLSERIGRNLDGVDEEELPVAQVVFTGAVLSMVARLGEWMPDLGLAGEDAAAPTGQRAVESR